MGQFAQIFLRSRDGGHSFSKTRPAHWPRGIAMSTGSSSALQGLPNQWQNSASVHMEFAYNDSSGIVVMYKRWV
eukprot:scaffold339316_cov21-Prasinocladus_malaysianus.AAC.1